MQNDIPDQQNPASSAGFAAAARPTAISAVDRAVDRSLAGRRQAVAAEVERLVSAALVLIQRTGDVQPRVSEIVREAGLSNQAFYRHFRSKQELLVAVLDQGVRILASYLGHRMNGAYTPRAEVSEWIRGMLAQALDAQGAEATRPFVRARGLLAEALPEEVRASEAQLTALLEGALGRAVETGELPHCVPERDAESIYHLAMGWVQARLEEANPADPADAARLEAFAMAALSRV